MQILACDDDPVNLRLVEALIYKLGHTPLCVDNGTAALTTLTAPHAPRLAILDWELPDHTGVQICRQVRHHNHNMLEIYLILLTSRRKSEDLVEGLEAGANDYVSKPFDAAELTARIRIGLRMIQLMDEVKVLSGLLPICAWCSKIRDSDAQWVKMEQYVATHSQAQFTHGICNDCRVKMQATP